MKMTNVLSALLLAGCGNGVGSLNVTTYGEDYIEMEIPASTGTGEPGFVDGHTVTYDKFLVTMSNVLIADHDQLVGAEMTSQAVFDLHEPGPVTVARFDAVGSQRWDEVSIEVKPARDAIAGNADAADVAMMNAMGYSVFVAGRIGKDGTDVDFEWGFETDTLYHECETDQGEAGVVVPNGGEAVVQFTIHGDHLFYDDLQSPDTVLRADAIIAADANADGKIALAELEAVDLTTLPTEQYGTGGDGTVEDLRQFVNALSRTVVHFQGEGECKAVKQ